MNKKKLKMYYVISVVYFLSTDNYHVQSERVVPSKLSERIKELEYLIKEGKVTTFQFSPQFEY